MKSKCVVSLIVLGIVAFARPADASIEFALDAASGGVIQFGSGGPGAGTFEFTGGTDFVIATSTGTGAAVGLPVNVIGTFIIDSIASFAGPPVIESSSVSPGGGNGIAIDDGAGSTLTGDLDFESISTVDETGDIQIRGNANISNLIYAGLNADLQQLVNTVAAEGLLQVSFFAPHSGDPDDPTTLSALVSGEVGVTNYQGRLTSGGEPTGGTDLVPEPASMLVWTVMGLVVGAAAYRRRGGMAGAR